MDELLGSLREVLLARSLRRAQRGDREAFRSLYRELYPVVWRFVRRRCPSDADAEELVGQTFFKLLEHLDRVAPERGVRGYVLGVASHALTDLARERARRDGEAVLDLADPSANALEKLVAGEDRARVSAQLSALPAQTRELLTLRYADGLRFSEIAQLTGLAEAAARQRVSRAVRELKSQLAEER